MTWGAVAIAGASLVGGALQSRSASKAARQQQQGADAAIEEQRAAREQYQANISPYLGLGSTALGQLQGLVQNPASFANDPAYQFNLDQGLTALDRSAAARGGLYSGGADVDRLQYAQGLASQEYGNQFGRLYNLASLGQNAATGAGTAALQSAGDIGRLQVGRGQAGAERAERQANIYTGALGGLSTAFGQYMNGRSPPPQSGGGGSIYNFGNSPDWGQGLGGMNQGLGAYGQGFNTGGYR